MNITKEQSKDTGLAFTLIFLMVGLITSNFIFFKFAVLFLVVTMVIPSIFKYPAFFWFGFSHLVGGFVSKILLSIVFFILVTPIGIIRKIIGKDSLKLKLWKHSKESVFRVRNHLFISEDLEKPY